MSEITISFVSDIWKPIPGYSPYAADGTGQIRNMVSGKNLNQREHKTKDNGSYLDVSVRPIGEDKFRSIGAHVLTCLAFKGHPPDDGQKYEVNHIDGNKHNNHEWNLEWSTRRDNIIHACIAGLRKNCNRVTVVDTLTGEDTWYYSVVECARQMNVKRGDVYRCIRNHHTVPWQGRYLFKMDVSKRVVTKHPKVRDILIYDHANKNFIVVSDGLIAERFTGVHQQSIMANLRAGKYKVLAGYSFRYLDDEFPLPEIPLEDAVTSREKYKTIREKNITLHAINPSSF